MLLRTLFIIALFAVLAETIVHGVHALAQIELRRSAAIAVHGEFESATTAVQRTLAAAIQAGGDPQNLAPAAPAPAATCILAAGSGCALKGRATIAFTAAPSPAATPCAKGACTVYMQNNDAVDEGRVSATISAEALAGNGAVLATRTAAVTFRTFRLAPYAALDGSLDGSLAQAGVGDDGGAAPNGTAPGSLIDVIYQNRVSKKSIPANVWRSQVQNTGAAPEAWSP